MFCSGLGSLARVTPPPVPCGHSLSTNGTVRGLGGSCWFTPSWATVFAVALGVTRASDLPIPCGHRLPFVLFKILEINTKKGWLSTLHQKHRRTCFCQ